MVCHREGESLTKDREGNRLISFACIRVDSGQTPTPPPLSLSRIILCHQFGEMHTIPPGCEAWILASELSMNFCLFFSASPKSNLVTTKARSGRKNLLTEFGIKLRFFYLFFLITAIPPDNSIKKSSYLLFPDFDLDFISMYLPTA